MRILTYCNAGALATAGYGTALGVIRSASRDFKNISVYACETRPYLQGARLTAWELMQDKIPVTLMADNMVGYAMDQGLIDMVVVGTDRVAANGDVANKIGTYTVATMASVMPFRFMWRAQSRQLIFQPPLVILFQLSSAHRRNSLGIRTNNGRHLK